MRTNPADQTDGAVRDFRRALAGPMRVSIDHAVSYWLEDASAGTRGQESDTTAGPFAHALDLIRSGTDPEALSVWALLEDGKHYLVAEGLILQDLAEGAAGLPPRRR